MSYQNDSDRKVTIDGTVLTAASDYGELLNIPEITPQTISRMINGLDFINIWNSDAKTNGVFGIGKLVEILRDNSNNITTRVTNQYTGEVLSTTVTSTTSGVFTWELPDDISAAGFRVQIMGGGAGGSTASP